MIDQPASPAAWRDRNEVPCANCAAPVDPLRAARVAIYDDRFRYFCSADCRERYDPNARRTPIPTPQRPGGRPENRPSDPDSLHISRRRAQRSAAAFEEVEGDGLEALASARGRGVAPGSEPPPSREHAPPLADEVPSPTDVGSLLVGISIVAGFLSAALVLAGPSSIALTARVVLVLVATGSFVLHAFTTQGDPSELHPVAATVAPVGAAVAVLAARLAGHPGTSEATGFAGVLVSTLAVIVWLVERARHPVEVERAHIRQSLSVVGHRIVLDEVVEAPADDLRAGEEIVIETGEVVPVDCTVVAGSAVVHPWLGATTTAPREEGDSLVAGARVVDGRLRASAGWAGSDRAWLRLTHDSRRRADIHAPLARFGRSLSTRGSVVLAVAAALAAFSGDRDFLSIAVYAAGAHAALANRATAQIAAIHVAEAVLTALRRGVVFRTADALDRAGRVSTAAFCARGTLLLGEPEVAVVEAFPGFEPDSVLALVAGAESGAQHPTAVAIQRAARARGVRPDGVRSPAIQPGLGVTAVASTGQALVVGSRGLMLRERIGVALAEARIVDLEAMGRTVVLVAVGGRLVGLVGLQDGLRPGARAAVQHLLDARIEPVLLSGDTRETCEALGRAVDIDHIRPEVLPSEVAEEIRRLADGGAVVAVLGRSPGDDAALSAADLSVALDSAGSTVAEWGVQLASDDVRDSAFALRLAHGRRRSALSGLLLSTVPGLAATLLVAVGLLPTTAPALAALGGGALALARVRPNR